MIDEILTSAGFVLNQTYRETLFIRPPQESYVVYNVSYDRSGPDLFNAINTYTVSFELYAYKPDEDSEIRIESELDKHALEFTKEERYYIQEEGLYQTIYNFSYTKKERGNN